MATESSSDLIEREFGIYLHIPFCVHRCSYCDFYSLTQWNEDSFTPFVGALIAEIKCAARQLKKERGYRRKVTSIFFGGGTPSLLPLPLLGEIGEVLQSEFDIASSAECTLEANPETVTEAYARGLWDLRFINRVSLGVQSFQTEFLQKLERLASPSAVHSAFSRFRKVGFDNINLDLIFAIPGQSIDQMMFDLRCAIEMDPTHISFYNLTLTPGHPLYSKLPADDQAATFYEDGAEFLHANNYSRYEISNFARPDRSCQHNLLYWNGGDFLGLGPSAASRFFWGESFWHRKGRTDLSAYLNVEHTDFLSEFQSTDRPQTTLEAVFLEIRRSDGIDLERFQRRYGYDIRRAKKYELFRSEGLLRESDGVLSLTDKGLLLADGVSRDLVDL